MQQCRERWCEEEGGEISWDTVVGASLAAPAFGPLIEVDDPVFSAPQADMPAEIAGYCRRTGQRAPSSRGEIARCAYESLVLKLASRVRQLERLAGRSIDVLHLVGGGVRNLPLCQWIADAAGKEVVTGPAETTVAGNLIMQLVATGESADLAEGRRIVARSSQLGRCEPAGGEEWDRAAERLRRLLPRS